MRIVLANPHSYVYGKTVLNTLIRRKSFTKYDYFITEYINHPNRRCAFFLDGQRSSFHLLGFSFPLFPKFFAWLELIAWMLINGISPFRHRVYFHISSLDPKKDVLVDFVRSFKDSQLPSTSSFAGIVVLFFTHYFVKASIIASYLHTFSYPILVAENDLAGTPYFQKFFPSVSQVYQLPFAMQPRFQPRQAFQLRKNQCLALGSMSCIDTPEYEEYFGSNILHPMRGILADQAHNFPAEISSLIRPYRDPANLKNNLEVPRGFRWLKKVMPYIILESLFGTRQSHYFRFNIVDKYNEYRMFVCPEEAPGLPSINVFEGMACGTAFLGIDDPMYTNLGLIPGVHYISYEQNNLSDLIQKIRYYQNNPESLQKIAETGRDFVRTHFHKQAVADTLWHDLETMSGEFAATGKFELKCSFVKEVKKYSKK